MENQNYYNLMLTWISIRVASVSGVILLCDFVLVLQ